MLKKIIHYADISIVPFVIIVSLTTAYLKLHTTKAFPAWEINTAVWAFTYAMECRDNRKLKETITASPAPTTGASQSGTR